PIDLTRRIEAGMPVYPGDPPVRFAPHSSLSNGGFALTRVEFGTHTGTHVDAPAHVREGGAGVDELPLGALVGPARVIDASHRGAGEVIMAADLGDELPEDGRVLVRTDWDLRFGEADYYERFPALSGEAVERLLAARV